MRLLYKSLFSINPGTLTFCSIIIVIGLFALKVPLLELIELKIYDLRFLARGQLKSSSAIVIAAIDEKSLDTEGRWPWPRSKIASLVDILSQDGAKVIGFDIGFLEPEENSQLTLIDELSQKVDNHYGQKSWLNSFIEESKQKADNDLVLAGAIEKSSADIVLGYFFHMDKAKLNYDMDQSNIDRAKERLSNSKYPIVIYEQNVVESIPVIRAYAPESNLEIFTNVAASSGYFTMQSDRDGVLRWMPLAIKHGEDLYPPLAVLCAWHYLDKPQLMIMVGKYGIEEIQMGDNFIPTDESGRLLINYLGPSNTFPHYSVSDILNGKVTKGTFKDKIVLIGATATGIYDLRNIPFSPLFPGVEVHANVIDNILTRNFITKPKWTNIYDLIAIIIMGIVVGIAIPRMSAIKGLFFVLGLITFYICFVLWLFVKQGAWLNVIYPLFILSMSYMVLTVYHYATEERERKKIKKAFTHYVSPTVIEEMLKDPSRLKLGGEEKVLTVLFSDLQGFTSTSERYTPQDMIVILSEYYTRMTEHVFDHQGMLKEYVGDEMMAIFGAPIDQIDHAKRACAAAIAMRDDRKAINEEWVKIGRPPLNARTGINSGNMLVGNLGSKYRFAYGVLGDHVNLGSRLEGLNKAYQTDILIGENTAKLVEGHFLLREVDMVRVVGREQPVRIYELVGNLNISLHDEQKKAFVCYEAGLEAYRERRLQEALNMFKDALNLWPSDGPSGTMVERCRIYLQSPPPEDWDGVFEAVHKY